MEGGWGGILRAQREKGLNRSMESKGFWEFPGLVTVMASNSRARHVGSARGGVSEEIQYKENTHLCGHKHSPAQSHCVTAPGSSTVHMASGNEMKLVEIESHWPQIGFGLLDTPFKMTYYLA